MSPWPLWTPSKRIAVDVVDLVRLVGGSQRGDERRARSLVCYEVLVVPEWLRTAEYALAYSSGNGDGDNRGNGGNGDNGGDRDGGGSSDGGGGGSGSDGGGNGGGGDNSGGGNGGTGGNSGGTGGNGGSGDNGGVGGGGNSSGGDNGSEGGNGGGSGGSGCNGGGSGGGGGAGSGDCLCACGGAESEPRFETEPEPESDHKPGPQPRSEPGPRAEPELRSESGPRFEPEPGPEPGPGPGPEFRPPTPPAESAFYLHEAVLHAVVGGPGAHAAQVRALAASPWPVRVVPFGVGAHPALARPFVYLEFADSPPVAYSGGRVESAGPHRDALAVLQELALPVGASRTLLATWKTAVHAPLAGRGAACTSDIPYSH
ncbi:hypothetical protein LV78_005164 [Actinosynnema pretiosum]|nr:hypothetical protein [Actinosynnema pretiosum]